jgi:hypothetical protein
MNMAVSVAEYLGQRTDFDGVDIVPVIPQSGAMCPFMDRPCDKANKSKPLHPICSVRKNDGTIWIVCEHRLCSTRQVKDVIKNINGKNKKERIPIKLVPHQVDILKQVATTIYPNKFTDDDIIVRREATIPLLESDNNYHADYIMRNIAAGSKVDEILLEMQGGGETSSTGKISEHVVNWQKSNKPTNKFLRQITKAGTIETNAWRRQQEQFLVKGNVVSQTGGKIAFAVGTLLFDYLEKRFRNANLRDLKKHNWTLCILAFKEDISNAPKQGSIPLTVDKDRLLFTNYSTFVRFLTDQGGPAPQIFEDEFLSLSGNLVLID